LEADQALASQLTAALREPGSEEPLTFAHRSELDTPGFASAVELLRVGEAELGELELRSLGAWDKGDEDRSAAVSAPGARSRQAACRGHRPDR
jgi:hypothetical protein